MSNKRRRVTTGKLEASTNIVRNIQAKRLNIFIVYAKGFTNRTITEIVGEIKKLSH